jgi:hypothetical protein
MTFNRSRPAMKNGFSAFPHRAVRRHRINWPVLVRDGLLTLAITWWVWWAQDGIANFWIEQLNFWLRKTALAGSAGVAFIDSNSTYALLPLYRISAPTLLPTVGLWWFTALGCMVLWGYSLWLPHERLPLIYFLRLVVLVQISSLVFFYLWPDSLPTTVAHFLTDVFRQAAGLMLLVPALFALTLCLFALPWWAKYGATAAALLFVTLFVPLQAACVAWILQVGGILFMPPLYLFFGLLPQVVALMGIYSFALSFLPSDEALAEQGLLDV